MACRVNDRIVRIDHDHQPVGRGIEVKMMNDRRENLRNVRPSPGAKACLNLLYSSS
jgi:hypothetical protein